VDGKFIITSKEAMLLEEPPKSMIIIGAGAIGVEFAYFYNSFGTKITLIEMMPSILPNEDKEITDILAKSFQKSGIEILTETKVISAVQEDNSAVVKIESEKQKAGLSAPLVKLKSNFKIE